MPDLEVYRTLLKVLAHKIRTPLSVVMNDLLYYDSLLPEEECERPIRRCREIADLLTFCSLPALKEYTRDELFGTILSVYREGAARLRPLNFPCTNSELLLETACHESLTILLQSFVDSPMLVVHERRAEGMVDANSIPNGRVKQRLAGRRSATYSNFSTLTAAHDIESLSAPLIDLTFGSYGINACCTVTEERLTLTLAVGGEP